jgi:alkylation response protein AidB-like acyl-CoA dehydrogenase
MDDFFDTDGLTDSQRDMLAMLRTFVDRDVLPVVHDLEQADEFPEAIVATMAEMGLFSLMIPEEYGGLGESLLTYALVVEELARGWMSLSGIINTHFIVAYLIGRYGTDEQRSRLLPMMATGEIRGAFSMSEPGCGSDVAAITTKAVRDGDGYVVNGRKMWLTNGARAGIVALLTKTGGEEKSVYRTMTTFLLEKPPGFGEVGNGLTIPPAIHKMGYRGVETTELLLDATRLPMSSVLGGEAGVGNGFYQMMDGIEVGRVNVAARGCGVGLRALELAIRYAQQREAFGSRIAEHQAVAFSLAEMATKVQAAHQMMVMAARRKDSGARNDMEAGMAKYLAAEYCKEVVEASLRIHGGYGYASESEIERLYRDAPLLLIGEGTAEMQKMIIGRRLLERYPLRG